jgi:hypothetical protein
MSSVADIVAEAWRAIAAVVTPGKKAARLRAAIREDLNLLKDLASEPEFGANSPVRAQLIELIRREIDQLTQTPARRPKVNWSTVATGLTMAVAFAGLTWFLYRPPSFPWYGWVTGTFAALGLLGAVAEITNPSGGRLARRRSGTSAMDTERSARAE